FRRHSAAAKRRSTQTFERARAACERFVGIGTRFWDASADRAFSALCCANGTAPTFRKGPADISTLRVDDATSVGLARRGATGGAGFTTRTMAVYMLSWCSVPLGLSPVLLELSAQIG